MKFSVERSWIKSVRAAKHRPNYGMTDMDSLLEEIVGNKLELSGPLINLFLREIGRGLREKLNRSKATGLVNVNTYFVPWSVFRHILILSRGYSCDVESSQNGVRHKIVMTKMKSLSRLFSTSRFSGENYVAYRHFK